MEDKTKLVEFLAWVQDNYTELGDDQYQSVDETDTRTYTRDQVVDDYLRL